MTEKPKEYLNGEQFADKHGNGGFYVGVMYKGKMRNCYYHNEQFYWSHRMRGGTLMRECITEVLV